MPAQYLYNGAMFNPSQAEVRNFFCNIRRKQRSKSPMTALETLAGHWVDEHPEYFPDLEDADAALQRVYPVESGKTNPFLHLSMHLTISEQCSIDQPHGVRRRWKNWRIVGFGASGPASSDGVPRAYGLGEPTQQPPARRRCLCRAAPALGHGRLMGCVSLWPITRPQTTLSDCQVQGFGIGPLAESDVRNAAYSARFQHCVAGELLQFRFTVATRFKNAAAFKDI